MSSASIFCIKSSWFRRGLYRREYAGLPGPVLPEPDGPLSATFSRRFGTVLQPNQQEPDCWACPSPVGWKLQVPQTVSLMTVLGNEGLVYWRRFAVDLLTA